MALPASLTGVEGRHNGRLFGSPVGTKAAVNELAAPTQLASRLPGSGGEAAFESARSARMAASARCRVVNSSSIGIHLGGMTPLAPERPPDLPRSALEAMLGAAMAPVTMATMAGIYT